MWKVRIYDEKNQLIDTILANWQPEDITIAYLSSWEGDDSDISGEAVKEWFVEGGESSDGIWYTTIEVAGVEFPNTRQRREFWFNEYLKDSLDLGDSFV